MKRFRRVDVDWRKCLSCGARTSRRASERLAVKLVSHVVDHTGAGERECADLNQDVVSAATVRRGTCSRKPRTGVWWIICLYEAPVALPMDNRTVKPALKH